MKNIIVATFIIFAVTSCTAAADCQKPENVSSAECKVINAVIDCTKGELPSVVAQLEPIVLQLVANFTGADGTIDWSHIDLSSLGINEGMCILSDIFTSQTMAPPKLAPGMVAPSPIALKQEIEAFRKTKGVAPGVKVHTAHGDY